MRCVFLLLLLSGATAVLSGCSQARSEQPAPTLATVAGQPITADDFRLRYRAFLLQAAQPDALPLRRAVLEQLITEKLMVRAARDGEAVDSAVWEAQREALRRKLLLEGYLQQALYDTLQVTEQDLRALFVRTQTSLKARHLYARTRAEADGLYARLQAGAAFEVLAREVFADTMLAARGGSVGYFGFDEMDPAFEDAAYALAVGEISAPVRTAQGYSIIQLEDRRSAPLLTEADFNQKRGKLERYARFRKQQQARARHLRAVVEALAPSFHGPAVERLVAQITRRDVVQDEEAGQAWLSGPLVTFGPAGRRETWTVADFRDRARYADAGQRAQVATRQDLTDFITGVVAREALVARALALHVEDSPAFEQALGRALDAWVYDTARVRVVADAEVPEDTVQAYFDAFGETLAAPARVQVWEIMTATKREALRLKQQLAGTSFQALARKHSLRPGADATGGALGWLTREQLGTFAAAVLEAEKGAVVGPLVLGDRYVLLKVGRREAGRPLTYEEARPRVAAQLRPRFEQEHLRAYAASLRARYDVAVDEAQVAALALDYPN